MYKPVTHIEHKKIYSLCIALQFHLGEMIREKKACKKAPKEGYKCKKKD